MAPDYCRQSIVPKGGFQLSDKTMRHKNIEHQSGSDIQDAALNVEKLNLRE